MSLLLGARILTVVAIVGLAALSLRAVHAHDDTAALSYAVGVALVALTYLAVDTWARRRD